MGALMPGLDIGETGSNPGCSTPYVAWKGWVQGVLSRVTTRARVDGNNRWKVIAITFGAASCVGRCRLAGSMMCPDRGDVSVTSVGGEQAVEGWHA